MKKSQIEKFAKSIIKYDGLSTRDLKWIFSSFTKQELKTLKTLLCEKIKNNKVIVSFAGELSDKSKKEIVLMFPNKKTFFKRNDKNIVAGIRFEYGDFVLDCSILGAIKKVLTGIKERL